MPPVHSITNQYHGINAHLQSWLQNENIWDRFHAEHLSCLKSVLQDQLREIAYEADLEPSLQSQAISEKTLDFTLDLKFHEPTPIDREKKSNPITMPLRDMLYGFEIDLGQYRAIGIYESADNRTTRGKPVAWIEVLSSSIKPPSGAFKGYHQRRLKLLRRGIVFIEIDYLHVSSPALTKIADYSQLALQRSTEIRAYPYHIIVIDPRPNLDDGQAAIWHFDVDVPVPTVTIPLNAGDQVEFDFGKPYKKTFEEMFYGDKVDYTQLPVNFETYSDDDQARIAARMLAVVEAPARGDNLESGEPLPIRTVTLEEALAEIKRLTQTYTGS